MKEKFVLQITFFSYENKIQSCKIFLVLQNFSALLILVIIFSHSIFFVMHGIVVQKFYLFMQKINCPAKKIVSHARIFTCHAKKNSVMRLFCSHFKMLMNFFYT
jgi:hypothetical protein